MSSPRLVAACWLLLVAVVIVLGGCKARQAESDPSGPQTGPYISAEARSWKKPSAEEARQFAATLEQAALRQDAHLVDRLVDIDSLLDRAIGGFDVSQAIKDGFIEGVHQGVGDGGGIAEQIVIAQSRRGGSYRLLRVHEVDGQRRVLFRLLFPDGRLNYHDFIVAKKPDGKVQAIDAYVFLSGELLSKTFRRSFLPLAANESRSVVQRLTGRQNDFVKHVEQLQEMSRYIKRGVHEDALAIYKALPETLQKDKNVLLLRLQAAMEVGDEEYEAAIGDFREHYADDPCIDMIIIDGLVLAEGYRSALAAIDRLDKAVGGDPHLDLLRANVHVLREDYDAVRKIALPLLESDDPPEDAFWLMLSVSVAEKDFDTTVAMLKTLEQAHGVQFGDVSEIPEYNEFVQSPQYRQWLSSR